MDARKDIFETSLNINELLKKLWLYRKYYILCLALFLTVAYLINRFQRPVYQNQTLVHVSSGENNRIASVPGDIGLNFGMFTGQNILDNEIEVIRSFSLVKKVVDNLDLKVSYYAHQNTPTAEMFKNTMFTRMTDLYKWSPVRVVLDQSVPQATYLEFKITFIDSENFELETFGSNVAMYNYIDDKTGSVESSIYFKNKFKFGDEVKTRYFTFRVLKNEWFDVDFTRDNCLYFTFNNMNWLAFSYQRGLTIEPTSQRSTLLKISAKGYNREAVTDFLNELTALYIERNLQKKNKIASSTVGFIDTQISEIADSLSMAETTLRTFRSANFVMDLSYQGQQIFERLNQLEVEKGNLNMQRKYYSYLKEYLSGNAASEELLSPSSMNIVDPILTNLVSQLIALNNERASLLRNSSSSQNIYLADNALRIDNIKKSISENVSNSLNTINMSFNEVNYRISALSGQISQMPKTELQLRGIERKFKLNDAIYTFLLQKRSEAQISRASSMPDYEVIDPALSISAYPVTPKRNFNYLIALVFALFLPTSVILGKDFLNTKIVSPEEAERTANMPLLGRVFHSFRRTTLVVNNHPNSSVTESFRALRTNFQFFAVGGDKRVILLTSTTSGEGKTFCAINLASAFALNGSKVVLLEFDLRRPKIHQEFASSNMIGISSYLIDKATVDDIIIPTQVENLDLVSAGPAAPNPAELIASEKTAELIQKLKEMYDYIIIDSAPVGILTETMILMSMSDVNIYVVRMEKTFREAFANTVKKLEGNHFTNISLLINDISVKRDAHKYGYDNKYYADDRKGGILARLFRSKKK